MLRNELVDERRQRLVETGGGEILGAQATRLMMLQFQRLEVLGCERSRVLAGRQVMLMSVLIREVPIRMEVQGRKHTDEQQRQCRCGGQRPLPRLTSEGKLKLHVAQYTQSRGLPQVEFIQGLASIAAA